MDLRHCDVLHSATATNHDGIGLMQLGLQPVQSNLPEISCTEIEFTVICFCLYIYFCTVPVFFCRILKQDLDAKEESVPECEAEQEDVIPFLKAGGMLHFSFSR